MSNSAEWQTIIDVAEDRVPSSSGPGRRRRVNKDWRQIRLTNSFGRDHEFNVFLTVHHELTIH